MFDLMWSFEHPQINTKGCFLPRSILRPVLPPRLQLLSQTPSSHMMEPQVTPGIRHVEGQSQAEGSRSRVLFLPHTPRCPGLSASQPEGVKPLSGDTAVTYLANIQAWDCWDVGQVGAFPW